MRISSHLRDRHGWSLAESVKWAPHILESIHEQEHQDRDCNHRHEENGLV